MGYSDTLVAGDTDGAGKSDAATAQRRAAQPGDDAPGGDAWLADAETASTTRTAAARHDPLTAASLSFKDGRRRWSPPDNRPAGLMTPTIRVQNP